MKGLGLCEFVCEFQTVDHKIDSLYKWLDQFWWYDEKKTRFLIGFWNLYIDNCLQNLCCSAYTSLIKDLSNLANSLTADQRSNVVLQKYAKKPQQLLTFSNPYKQDQTDFCLFL